MSTPNLPELMDFDADIPYDDVGCSIIEGTNSLPT